MNSFILFSDIIKISTGDLLYSSSYTILHEEVWSCDTSFTRLILLTLSDMGGVDISIFVVCCIV